MVSSKVRLFGHMIVLTISLEFILFLGRVIGGTRLFWGHLPTEIGLITSA